MEGETLSNKTQVILLIVSILISLGGIFLILKATPSITGAVVSDNLTEPKISSAFWDSALSFIFVVLVFTLTLSLLLSRKQ